MITDRTIFKYTLEVYCEADEYRAISRRCKRKKNLVDYKTKFTSPDKTALCTQAYPPTRQGKIVPEFRL
ncbi:MAG: hypothetical protein G5663_01540 [Serratia symbiotica]|nr:hypothetical protein [Serratia symbiotica]